VYFSLLGHQQQLLTFSMWQPHKRDVSIDQGSTPSLSFSVCEPHWYAAMQYELYVVFKCLFMYDSSVFFVLFCFAGLVGTLSKGILVFVLVMMMMVMIYSCWVLLHCQAK